MSVFSWLEVKWDIYVNLCIVEAKGTRNKRGWGSNELINFGCLKDRIVRGSEFILKELSYP